MQTLRIAVVAVALVLAASRVHAQSLPTAISHEAPTRELRPHRALRWGALVSGALLFSVAYVPLVAFAYSMDTSCGCNDAWSTGLLVPIAGPIVELAIGASQHTDDGSVFVFGAMGVLQAIGAGVAIVGLIGRRVEPERERAWNVAPMPVPSGAGLALTWRM